MNRTVTHRRGFSSIPLARELGLTQKSAWYMQHRLGEVRGLHRKVGTPRHKLHGVLEVDEVCIGGLENNKHAHMKRRSKRGPDGQQKVLGFRERGGRVIAKLIYSIDQAAIHAQIARHIQAG